jgi:hypothetical protein
MASLIRKEIPLAVVFVAGWIILLDPFFDIPIWNSIATELQIWASVLVAFSLILAVFQALRHQVNVIQRRREQWYLGIWFMLVLAVTFYLGLSEHTFYGDWYNMMAVGTMLTMNATTGLYTISATYRAFRIRNLDAALLTLTAVLTQIGSITVGAAIWGGFPLMRSWLQDVSSGSYFRAGDICIGVGAVAFGLRTLLGKEKGQLGEIAK